MMSYTKFTSQMDGSKIPRTLKFILQILVLILLVVIITSIIAEVLTFINFEESFRGIDITCVALTRVNLLRVLRPVVRDIVNIANGITVNSTEVIDDRFSYYISIIDRFSEDIRLAQVKLSQFGIVNDK